MCIIYKYKKITFNYYYFLNDGNIKEENITRDSNYLLQLLATSQIKVFRNVYFRSGHFSTLKKCNSVDNISNF